MFVFSTCGGIPFFLYLLAQILGARKIVADDEQPVVIEICDNDLIVGRKADPARRVKLLPFSAFKTVFVDEFAVRRKQLNAMVARVAHQDFVAAVTRHVPRIVKLAMLKRGQG